ncbi:phytoene/squalene synthase family protein, partial [Schumannella luteola]
SSSFGMASRLFPRRCEAQIAAIYALVRVADEIVDGTAAEAGLDAASQLRVLDEFEIDTERALASGFSANLVVQAFADVARAAGFGTELTAPFFASMRRDLQPVAFDDEESLREYVYGSAEVVGLMCLRVFTSDSPVDPELDDAARALGSAFQKVNFLRDLADDRNRLDREYLPAFRRLPLEAAKAEVVADIRDELRRARAGIPLLPADCRLAVAAATALFGELLDRIEALPAEALLTTRVSVPTGRKLALVARERMRLRGGR